MLLVMKRPSFFFLFFKIYPFKVTNLKDKEKILWSCQEIRTTQLPGGKKIKLTLDISTATFSSRRQWSRAHKIFMWKKEKSKYVISSHCVVWVQTLTQTHFLTRNIQGILFSLVLLEEFHTAEIYFWKDCVKISVLKAESTYFWNKDLNVL